MTTQEITTNVNAGPIHFRVGFNGSLKYPTYKLIELFLNLNPQDEDAIAEFCSAYKYWPNGYPGELTLTKAFTLEQTPLKNVALKAINNVLSGEDLLTINDHLPVKKMRVILTNKSQLYKNTESEELEHVTNYLNKSDKSKYLLETYSTSGLLCNLWEDVVKFAVEQQNLKSCRWCGKFFINTHHRQQITCSSTCQIARKKSNQRARKQYKSTVPRNGSR